MALNLIKLCVGAQSIDDLADWQAALLAEQTARGGARRVFHTTMQRPKREAEVLGGGSLYWVIKGLVQVRQRVVALEDGRKEDGSPCCLIVLDPGLVAVRPTPRRAFQGWRYLEPLDAPPDLSSGDIGALADVPLKMRRELAELCLI